MLYMKSDPHPGVIEYQSIYLYLYLFIAYGVSLPVCTPGPGARPIGALAPPRCRSCSRSPRSRCWARSLTKRRTTTRWRTRRRTTTTKGGRPSTWRGGGPCGARRASWRSRTRTRPGAVTRTRSTMRTHRNALHRMSASNSPVHVYITTCSKDIR